MTQNVLRESRDEKRKSTIKEGSVTKQGGRIKNWKKRWCVLNEEGLHYFKAQNSIEKGSIHLENILACASEDKPSTKRKYCFKVKTVERTYRICATDSLDRDEWVESITKLLKTKDIGQQKQNGDLKSSNSVDISKIKIDDDDSESSAADSSTPTSYSNSFLKENPSKTIVLTPIMISLKDKFALNTFGPELNRKKDLLSLEETERVLNLLQSHIENEIEIANVDRDREIKLIIKQINKLKDQELESSERLYNQKRLEILNEINKKSQK
ncbi:hypothetical protein CYY_008239 [Polysphondylium violaceum]|uniref:PH domain-containing protein n=1 Tax=Polysphondylium violaceum TaxID=133409 RepID=A0A8J4PQP6_9MYCE|nr:hypothetical protein CYY_008239 [Polysphondylium violaceum]